MTREMIFRALCAPSELFHKSKMERPDLFISNLSTDQCLPISIMNLEAKPARLTVIRCSESDMDLDVDEATNGDDFFRDDNRNRKLFNDRMREVADRNDYVIAGVCFEDLEPGMLLPHITVLKNDPSIFDSEDAIIWFEEYCHDILICSREFTLLYEVGEDIAYVIEFVSDGNDKNVFVRITKIEYDGVQAYKKLCFEKWWDRIDLHPWEISYYAKPEVE